MAAVDRSTTQVPGEYREVVVVKTVGAYPLTRWAPSTGQISRGCSTARARRGIKSTQGRCDGGESSDKTGPTSVRGSRRARKMFEADQRARVDRREMNGAAVTDPRAPPGGDHTERPRHGG